MVCFCFGFFFFVYFQSNGPPKYPTAAVKTLTGLMQFLFVFFSHTDACFCSGDSSLPLDQHHLCLTQLNSVFTHHFMFFSSPFSFYKRKHQIQGKCQWTPATVLPAPLPFLSPTILLCFPLIPSTAQTRCSTYPMMY